MDSRDIYGPVTAKIIGVGAAVALLALAVSSLAYLNIRPMVGYLNGAAGMIARERSRRKADTMKQ